MNLIQSINNKTILISPLDWGFGHTTRCVSIIRNLINNNEIIFAGNNNQINFITKEFPKIKTEFIQGYNINLSSQKSTYSQIAKQSLKISKAIQNEYKWVKKFVTNNKIDLIISDNRYAFRHNRIESIFIGHQLNLDLPHLKKLINKRLIHYVNRFNKCWIPDSQELNLSGILSDTNLLKIPFEHVGLLCRFTKKEVDIKYDYLAIISGPSPENQIFLNQIQKLANRSNKRIVIVSPILIDNASTQKHLKRNNIDENQAKFTLHHLPTSDKLNQLINESDCIISRAGYTTIMELATLNKKAILIPTKGQFEQEYLAKHINLENFTFIDTTSKIKF